jgi:hypothetical protein
MAVKVIVSVEFVIMNTFFLKATRPPPLPPRMETTDLNNLEAESHCTFLPKRAFHSLRDVKKLNVVRRT